MFAHMASRKMNTPFSQNGTLAKDSVSRQKTDEAEPLKLENDEEDKEEEEEEEEDKNGVVRNGEKDCISSPSSSLSSSSLPFHKVLNGSC